MAISGAKKDREVLAECLKLLKRGEAQHLLVTELSRLGRNLRQVLGIVEDLTESGVNIYFQSQGMNTMKAASTLSKPELQSWPSDWHRPFR